MAKITVPRSVLVFPAVFNALVFSSSALAAGTWYDARNDAMGGTGVASSNYGSAVLANPALMTKAKPEDNVSIIIPSAGAQITDKDKMVDKIDNITDTVNRYQDLFGNATGFELLRRIPEIQAASGDLANTLRDLRGNKANATAGAAIAVTIPNETLPFAFITKAYGTAHVRANVKEGDIVILQGVADGTFAGIPGGAFGLANVQNLLGSSANGLAALNTDYGIAVAHEFTIAGQPVSIGVTPKLQKTWLYNYSASIYNYDKNDLRDGRYRSTESGFNIDAGVATVFAENWTLGVTGQNLVSRDLETKEVNGYRDTYEIRPLVTAGLAWDKGPVTLTGDVDLTETHRFKSQENSQYAGVGAEYRVLDWLQLRAGYRADMRSKDENVATAGFGLSPFNNSVHLDLAGSVGQNNTWGAMAQLGFNF